jgi:hypothetical protein
MLSCEVVVRGSILARGWKEVPAMLQTPISPSPTPHVIYADPGRHNVAAIASLVCAILFPLTLYVSVGWNVWTHFAPEPDWLGTLIALWLTVLPAATILFGGVGLVRSFTRPQLRRSRWQAIVGLIFGVMWIGGYFLL